MIFGSFKLIENLIELFILLGCLTKVFQYIRYKEQFTFFVQIFTTVINELTEFMTAFLIGLCTLGSAFLDAVIDSITVKEARIDPVYGQKDL